MKTLDVIQTMADYYGKEMSESQIDIYRKTLDDISPELLDAALTRHIKTGHQWMPKVAELRKAAREVVAIGSYTGPGFIEANPQVDNYWRAIHLINHATNDEFEVQHTERWFQAVFPKRHGHFADEVKEVTT